MKTKTFNLPFYLALIFAAIVIAAAFCGATVFVPSANAADTVRIKFEYKNVGGDVYETEIAVGGIIGFPENPVRNGYNFAGWVDANGQEYNGLPVYSDRVFRAKWTLNDMWLGYFSDYSAQTVYGDDAVLEVKNLSDEIEYVFRWAKRAAGGVWTELDGKTEEKLVLKNVSDSGTYRVEVKYKDPVSGAERTAVSADSEISILPKTVTVRALGAEGLLYDGREKTVGAELSGLIRGDTAAFSIDGNSAVAVGTYRARVFNLSNPNYKLPENAGFDFEIKRAELKFSEREGLPELSLKAKRGFSDGVFAEYSTLTQVPEGVNIADGTVLGKYAFSLTGYDAAKDGEISVRIKVGSEVAGNSALKILFKSKDGTLFSPDFAVDGDKIAFSVNADGEIVIVGANSAAWWYWLLFVGVAMIAPVIIVAIVVVSARKKGASDETPPDGTKPDDGSENDGTPADVRTPAEPEEDLSSDIKEQEQSEERQELEGAEKGVPSVDTDISFNKKIAESDGQIKEWYSVIKNDLLSYREVKSRVSATCDSFRISRKLLAKVTIIGTTLRLSLALDPDKEKYNDGRFPHKNKGDKPMYKDVPFQVKIKTDLGLRRARALISEMMTEKKIKRDTSYEKIDYAALYSD